MVRMDSSAVSEYVSRGHKQVQGWCSEVAMELTVAVDRIQKEMDIGGNIAEIGVHHGKLFILLKLLARATEHAVAVDLFSEQELNIDLSGMGDEEVFLANVQRFVGAKADLAILRGDSTRLAAHDLTEAAGGPMRLFSVDGGHTAAITIHDLASASHSLAPGGVILLDDYFNADWPAISEGTNRFLLGPENPGLVPFVAGGNKLLFTTDERHARAYLTGIIAGGLSTAYKESEMFGHPILCVSYNATGGSFPVRALRELIRRLGLD